MEKREQKTYICPEVLVLNMAREGLILMATNVIIEGNSGDGAGNTSGNEGGGGPSDGSSEHQGLSKIALPTLIDFEEEEDDSNDLWGDRF